MKKSIKISWQLLLLGAVTFPQLSFAETTPPVVSAPDTQIQIRSRMLRAMEVENDPALAINLLMEVLRLDPANDFALLTIVKQSHQIAPKAQRELALNFIKISGKFPANFPLLLHSLELAQQAKLPVNLIDQVLTRGLQAQLNVRNRPEHLEPFFINLFVEFANRQAALGQFDPAATMFRELLSQYPDHEELRARGLIFFSRATKTANPPAKDVETFNQLLQYFEYQAATADENGLIDLCELYQAAGLPEKALALLEPLIVKNPEQRALLEEKLRILGMTGQYHAAIDAAQPLLTQKDIPAYLVENLGFWYYKLGNYQEAVKYFQQLETMQPGGTIPVENLLIQSLLMLKKWPEAQQRIDRMPAKDAFWKLLFQADLYNKTGQAKKALIALDNFTESHPELLADENNERIFFLAYLNAAQKSRNQQAIWQVYEVLKENGKLNDPDFSNALGYLFAEFNFALGEAEVLLKSALAQSPDHPAILDSVAWLYFRQGKLVEAQAKIDRALSLPYQQEIDSYAELFDHAGDIYLALGKDAEALGFYEKALKEPESDNINSDNIRKKIEKLQQKSK